VKSFVRQSNSLELFLSSARVKVLERGIGNAVTGRPSHLGRLLYYIPGSHLCLFFRSFFQSAEGIESSITFPH
jgi:hypothetical protein